MFKEDRFFGIDESTTQNYIAGCMNSETPFINACLILLQ